MSVPLSQQMREQLTFEQKARYDALLARRQKSEGTATVLSLPLLGTFGLEHFYLGNTVRGVLSLIFSWTLIPTIIALFDLITGDVKRQVAYANERIARQVYQNVIDNTPKPEDIPAAAASVVAPPPAPTPAPAPTPIEPQSDVTTTTVSETLVAGTLAADAATEAPVAEAAPADAALAAATDALPDAAPAAPMVESEVVSDTVETDASAVTTATFTETQSSAEWQQGMNEPVTTSDSNTVSYTDVAATEPEVTSTVIEEVAPAAVVVEEAAPAPAPAAPADGGELLASDGVLVFLADDEPAAPAPVATEVESVTATETDTTEQTVYQETISEQDHASVQEYKDGKLVSATRSDNTLTGEINTLLTQHSTEDLLAEVDARLGPPATHSDWVDVSPLHAGDAPADAGAAPTDAGTAPATDAAPAAPQADAPAAQPTSDTPTDAAGGGVGSGGADTNVPGGELGPGGGNAPGGGLGN